MTTPARRGPRPGRRQALIVALALGLETGVAGCAGTTHPGRLPPVRTTSTSAAASPAVPAKSNGGRRPSPALASRPFDVHVPPSYSPTTPAPLLILLHGFTSSGAAHESYFHLTKAADAHGMLYVHPDGTKDRDGNRFWNATEACCDIYGSDVDDSAYLTALIGEVEAQYNVDRHRIFFVGHSNGGFMSYRMACDHADQVAAVVSVAGATFADVHRCNPSQPVAILEIHGTADETIRYDGGTRQGQQYPSAAATVAAWAAYDGCKAQPDDTAPTPHQLGEHLAPVIVRSYSTNCVPGGHAELWTEPGAPHVPAFSASFGDEIVAFLLAHPKP